MNREQREEQFCYNCKHDVRNENGIMTDCSHPDREKATYCCAWALYNGERPHFTPKSISLLKGEKS